MMLSEEVEENQMNFAMEWEETEREKMTEYDLVVNRINRLGLEKKI